MADRRSAIFLFHERMEIESIATSGFRNLDNLNAEFAPGINIFYGDNGSGKTSLLEALFTLCLTRSQRGAADLIMLNVQSDFYRLEGRLRIGNRTADVAVAFQRGGRKKITIDGVVARPAELYEKLSVVSSGPEDSEILAGAPSARRLFLDVYLSQMSPAYLSDLSDYQKVLVQKNAALRREMDPSPFEPLLIDYGVQVMFARRRFLDQLGPLVCAGYESVSRGETLEMDYHPRVPWPDGEGDSAGALRAAFEQALAAGRSRERARQVASVGPHRDDIDIKIGGLPARTHGSQGQWRTAAVCLKLAVYELLKAKRGTAPILLLDEIFAELDHTRALSLMTTLADAGQIFLTTAVEPPESLASGARKFRIRGGRVEEVH